MKWHLNSFAILASTAVATIAHAEIKTVTAVIDMSKSDSAVEAIIKLSNDLEAADKTLYLDLTLRPSVEGEKYLFPVDRVLSRDGTSKAVKCDDGWERFGAGSRQFVFHFNDVYNHLLFSIWHAGEFQAPYSTIACEYNADAPGTAKFVVRGYFAKSALSVPTAVDIELRPVSPPQ
jgi:hypothetical protein